MSAILDELIARLRAMADAPENACGDYGECADVLESAKEAIVAEIEYEAIQRFGQHYFTQGECSTCQALRKVERIVADYREKEKET